MLFGASRQMCSNWVLEAWDAVPESLVYKAWVLGGYVDPTKNPDLLDPICNAIILAASESERRDRMVQLVESDMGAEVVSDFINQTEFDGSDMESEDDGDDDDDSAAEYMGDRVSKEVDGRVVNGSVTCYGPRSEGGKIFTAWTITYDEEIVEYVDGTRGFKEDLNFDELEEAIELYEHEGKDLEEEEESEDE